MISLHLVITATTGTIMRTTTVITVITGIMDIMDIITIIITIVGAVVTLGIAMTMITRHGKR